MDILASGNSCGDGNYTSPQTLRYSTSKTVSVGAEAVSERSQEERISRTKPASFDRRRNVNNTSGVLPASIKTVVAQERPHWSDGPPYVLKQRIRGEGNRV